MKRSLRARASSPLPSCLTKMPNKTENGRPRMESAVSRTRGSASRRSRSPRRKKSPSPAPKRGISESEKRPSPRSSRSGRTKSSSKRSRMSSSSSRSKSPPPRRISREKLPSYCTNPKDSISDRATSRSRTREDRFSSKDKYLVDRPSFRGPDKDLMLDRDSLKKIVVNMRDTPVENDSIKRDIVNAEDITVVRRAATSRRWQYQNEMDNWNDSVTWKDQMWDCYCDDDEEAGGNTSEGSRPIFDRDEIKNNSRKYDEDVRESRRIFSGSPPHSGRRPCSSERFRVRDSYYEDRSARSRDLHVSRFPPRDYPPHTYERLREERPRCRRSRSRERSRDFAHDRRDRYDERDYRRARIRGRSHTRSYRRHPSPVDFRRINGRRLRSPEREVEARRREQDLSDKKYSSDYPMDSHSYYEGDAVEGGLTSPSRGGGGGSSHLPYRTRGGSVMPMVRAGDVIMRGAPPVRPVRAVFLPRVPAMGRRLPFPPRLIRPIVRPVIRVIAPVIPVRSPSVIPVRHPVIPLPFQCEAFR